MFLVTTLFKIFCVVLFLTQSEELLIQKILNKSNTDFQHVKEPTQIKIDYINPDIELPEYKVYKKQFASVKNTSQLSNTIEQLGPVLCRFSDVSENESPTFAIYCIIIALAWLCLMITLCFGYLRQTLERLRGIIHQHGFRNNRTYNLVNTDRT
jgi:hypothetical protein